MSLSFVYGAAGSGKSTYVQDFLIRESSKNPDVNYLLIVPDQFTMQTQVELVNRHPDRGIMNLDVLSFGRLSYRVFEEVGKPSERMLDDTGKSLVIRRVASKVAGSMPYIGKNLNKIGYVHEVKSSLSEFMQYGISPMDLQKMANETPDGLLRHKLNDLFVIYDAFLKYTKDTYITGEESLDVLCEKITQSKIIKDCVIVFDGFTGFTPIQERVILKLLLHAKKVIVTLTLGEEEDPLGPVLQESLFYLSKRTAKRLTTKAEDLHVLVEEPVRILPKNSPRFSNRPELSHLEKNLFRYPIKTYSDTSDAISCFAASDITTEVKETCLRILELVRKKQYQYRDIAIITGNMENYAPKFEEEFQSLGIPYFMDQTNKLVLNPFIEYLKGALKVIETDYSYNAVFHFLRSGFTDIKNSEIDRLDVYVKSLNVRGSRTYHKAFSKLQRGMKKELAEVELVYQNETREQLVSILAPLEKPAKTAGDYVRNLYDFLTSNHSFEKCKAYEDKFLLAGEPSKAREYAQIYRLLMDLLDTIVALIGDEEMPLEEFYSIFDAGISELKVGMIPQSVDKIVVGDVKRTRLREVKALFFLGINDGNVPQNGEKGGILSNLEREAFARKGIDLAPTPREEMYQQKLYLYMNLCKPSDFVTLSFAKSDSEGKTLKPAYLMGELQKLFPNIVCEQVSDLPDYHRVISKKDSYHHFAVAFRNMVREQKASGNDADLVQALKLLYEDNDFLAGEIEKAAFARYEATPLSKEVVRLLYGVVIDASISRMELFAKCAYAYFLKYGMALKKNENYEFMSMDLGNVYHGVLDIFSKKLQSLGLSWKDFTKEQGEKLVSESVKEYVENYEQGILQESGQSRYIMVKLNKILTKTVETLQYHVKQGKFVPYQSEYSFVRDVTLQDGETNLRLKGKIDRLDLYETEDGKVYIKVLDYKSSAKDMDVTKIYYGISEQLSIYMSEALDIVKKEYAGKEVFASAMLYYALSNPMIEATERLSDEAVDSLQKKELRVKGFMEDSMENLSALDENVGGESLVIPVRIKKDGDFDASSLKHVISADAMDHVIDYTKRMSERIGEQIVNGDIKIRPIMEGNHNSCAYCEYKGICRFDEKIPGYVMRKDSDISKGEAEEAVLRGDGHGDYLFD